MKHEAICAALVFPVGDLVAMVDPADGDLATFRWHLKRGRTGGWYAVRSQRRGGRQHHLRLHRVIAARMGLQIDGYEVDHRNGDTLDCRRANLRRATRLQNAKNISRRSDNTSGVRGVGWDTRRQLWRARIAVDGRRISLGHFPTLPAAARAYAKAARRYHGEFARAA
jgi:hypothetical protein